MQPRNLQKFKQTVENTATGGSRTFLDQVNPLSLSATHTHWASNTWGSEQPSLIAAISDSSLKGLTYPKGTTIDSVMEQSSMTMHRENRMPWHDVTSTCSRRRRLGVELGHVSSFHVTTPRCHSYFALEAEDGDRQTHQRSDAKAQNHWLGVVEAVDERQVCHVYCLPNVLSRKRGRGLLQVQETLTLNLTVDSPWHEPHHEGHAHSLDRKPQMFPAVSHFVKKKLLTIRSTMFELWCGKILTKRTNKITFQGNCLLLVKKCIVITYVLLYVICGNT